MNEEQTKELLEILGDLFKELAYYDKTSWKEVAWKFFEDIEKKNIPSIS